MRAPRFGTAGTFVATADSSLGFSYWTYAGPTEARGATVSVAPALDVFVIDNLSIGGTVFGTYGNSQGYGADGSLVRTESTRFGGAARIGYAIPLGRLLSLYPVVTLGVETLRTEHSVVTGGVTGSSVSIGGNPLGVPKSSQEGPYGVLYVPLLLHPKPSFFIGFGPAAFHELAAVQGVEGAIGQRTTFAARAVVGGTFGGPAEVEDPDAAPAGEPASARRFGQAYEWVLTGELFGGVATSSYSGSDSSSTSYAITPAFDFFVADHVAIGIAPSVSSLSVVDARPDGSEVKGERFTVSIAPRVGVEIPLGKMLSLFPRVGLGVAYEDRMLSARGGLPSVRPTTTEWKSTATFVSLFAPLLVHAAPHFFVGWGPSLYHELGRKTDGTSVEITETTLGGRLVVGGWL